MYFKDSCITRMTPYSLHEESTVVPDNIFPAFIGTSGIVLGIDASGLQNISDGKLQKAFGSVEATGDTYVVQNGRMGDHISEKNVLPFGYLAWKIRFDSGEEMDPSANRDGLSCWTRDLYIDEGRVVTSMLLGYYAELRMEATAVLNTNAILLKVGFTPYNYKRLNYVPARIPHTATVEIALHMRSRQGKDLYDSASLQNGVLNVSATGYEKYENRIRLSGSGKPEIVFQDGALKAVFTVEADKVSETAFVLDFDGEFGVDDYAALERKNLAARAGYYAGIASVRGVSAEEAFLYNNSHYLCMSGFDYSKGLTIGMPYMFPKWWRCSTFWDSHFVMDGLMRSGAKKEADEFVKYLYKSMNPEGKPFPWMFAYDGKPTVDDSRDIAPLVMCAHATTAAKHYAYFRDESMLRKYILPIVERVALFGAKVLFSKEPDGKYILSVPVSNDVVEEQAVEINQTFTALWFLSVFAQCLSLQSAAGKARTHLLEEIVTDYRLEANGEEYFHARGMTAQECPWASWVPFLLYPTEALPFVDMDLFNKTRAKYTYPRLYMEKQGSYQPWTEFMEASSDFRRGAVEEGYKLRLLGMEHCFGTGLFSEIGPHQQTCGIAPYISAHGTYITAFLYQFVATDIWTNRVGIFDRMPSAYAGKDIRVQGIRCAGGITVSAELTGNCLFAEICAPEGQETELSLKIPEELCADNVRVFVNGEKKTFETDGQRISLRLCASGKDRIEIK